MAALTGSNRAGLDERHEPAVDWLEDQGLGRRRLSLLDVYRPDLVALS
jgi:hypothetical protein